VTTVLTCPKCGAPTTWNAPFCAYCRAPLTWGSSPVDLDRGDPLFALDFASDALPEGGKVSTQRTDGALVEIRDPRFEQYGPFAPRVRDVCIAMRGTALDDSGSFGVSARVQEEGGARTSYQLKVYPSLRAWMLRREATYTGKVYSEAIADWEHTPAVAGVGQENEIELRCADSLFQVLINGRRVVSTVDASFGFGGLAWVVGTMLAEPAQVVLRSVAAWQVR
jgi:hypothetical protein